MELELSSGLTVILERSTVGPDVGPGFGDTHVLYPAAHPPPEAQRWDGWPLGWQPAWSNYGAWPAWYGARLSTVFTCVDLNGRILSTLPTFVRLTNGDIRHPPAWSANPEPEVYASWAEFLKAAVYSYQLRGEIIVWATARYATGYPARFVLLNPDWVNVESRDGRVAYSLAGEDLDRDDVCHIKYAAFPGDLRGHGPLEAAFTNVVGAAALERYSADLATRGGVPWGVMKHPNTLKREQAEQLRDQWLSAATARGGAPAILSGGVDLQTLTLSPKDMALLEVRQFDETRVASAMGVPPYLVGLPSPSGMTYENSVMVAEFHWRATLRTFAVAIGTALSNWALPNGSVLTFNSDDYTRPAVGQRMDAYRAAFDMVDPVTGQRVLTVEEIRAAEGLPTSGNAEDLAAMTEAT